MAHPNNIRILFLSHYYPPEMGGAAARISGLAKWLARFGHKVTVLTGYPNYLTGKIFPEYKNKKNKIEFNDEVKIIRVKVFPVLNKMILVRLINYFTFILTAFLKGIRKRNDYDIIIASSPPITIGILGNIFSKIFKIPWIFDIRDIWPDVGVEAGILKEDGFKHRLLKSIAEYLYQQATYITPVTKSKLTKIQKCNNIYNKISVVSNGVDIDLIDNASQIDWRKDIKLENKFILTFAGLIGIAQGVNVILETAIKLKDNTDIHFLIVGEGVEKQKLQDYAKSLELSNVTFLSRQPKELIPSLLKTSDVAIIPLVNDKLEDAVPSKLLEAWACRLPVILIASGEASQLVSDTQGGISINTHDIDGIKSIILELKNSPKLMQKFASNGYGYVSKYLKRETLARELEKVIYKILE